MSWLDKIKNDIIITCGDGKSYSPSWMNASKEIEWHLTEFYFPEENGTLAKRKKKLGNRYNLELYFQGDNHLENSLALETSSNFDSSPWKIQHPFYGVLNVQISKFFIDNTGLNISKWTGAVVETILETNPKTNVSVIDDLNYKKELLDEDCVLAVTAKPNVNDVIRIKESTKTNFNKTIPILTIPEEIETYFNLFNAANSAVNNLVASPSIAMRTTVAVINAPALFTANLKSKMNLLLNQFQTLQNNLSFLTIPASKQIYQVQSTALVSSMAIAAVNAAAGSYSTNQSVYAVINQIISSYNTFVTNLNALQSVNGGAPTSFIPNQTLLFGLNQIINSALANLFTIALNAKKQYSIITEKDTNWILLAHRFYGLDANDQNIGDLINQNNLGLNSILQIRSGTEIVYYV